MGKRKRTPKKAPGKAATPSAEDLRFSPLLPAEEDISSDRDYKLRTEVWQWKGGKWHFASLPKKHSAEIQRRFGAVARGWGSIRIEVSVGDTTWKTSLFPDKKKGQYIFAIKAAVRKAEGIAAGDKITAHIHIL